MTMPSRPASGPGLKRAIGTYGAGAFVVTNMIGTGIFTIPAIVRTSTESGLSALGVWLAGAFLALCGAFCYAELATRMPRVGGEYHYLARIFGPRWGFLSGWISFFVGFPAAIAFSSIAAVTYWSKAVGGWDPSQPMIGGITRDAFLAALLVGFLGVIHSLGIRPGTRLQTALAAAILGSIAVLVFSGLATGRGDWAGLWTRTESRGSWWVALIQVSFAYSGWNAATYLAGEVRRPRRTLPRALLGGTLVVTATYLALNILFLFALPADSWTVDIAVGQTAAQALFGTSGSQILSALIAIALLGSISAMTAAGPRIYYAMAQDGLGPKLFSRVKESNGAPAVAILSQSAVAALLALTGAFEELLIYVGSALLLFNALTVAGVYAMRRNGNNPDQKIFRVPGYPVTPAIFLAAVVFAWGQALVQEPRPTLAALVTVGAGILFYSIGIRRGWLNYDPPASEEPVHASVVPLGLKDFP